MKKRKYNIGDWVNGREIVGYKGGGVYLLRCPKCNNVATCVGTYIDSRGCKCSTITHKSQRYSGLEYENSKDKLEAIKNKYRNGVSDEDIKNWINSL